nr:MAG TPA: hypothetical protein [Caudoviricetes sp.]
MHTFCCYVQLLLYARSIHIIATFVYVNTVNLMLYYGHKQKIRRRAAAIIRAGCTFPNTFRFPSCVNRVRVKTPKDKKYTALKS